MPDMTALSATAPDEISATTPAAQAEAHAPALPVLAAPRLKARRVCGSELRGSMRGSMRNAHDPQVDQLMIQNARLREELQSLRDMYAKHTAYTELKCDKQLREKDQECVEWYKTRKQEIQQLRAAVTVMKALFEKKRGRILIQMEVQQQEVAAIELDLRARIQQTEDQHDTEIISLKGLIDTSASTHVSELASAHTAKRDVEGKVARLEDQLEEHRRENERLKETNRQKTQEAQVAKDRLAEVEKNANIDSRDEQIAALESELQTSRRSMKDRWKKEVESLRQELMDYVRFIVHILPDNWTETEAKNKVPPELRDQLLKMAGSNPPCSPGSALGESRAKSGQSPRSGCFLPPTDILMKGAAFGGQYAHPGAPWTQKRNVNGLDTTF